MLTRDAIVASSPVILDSGEHHVLAVHGSAGASASAEGWYPGTGRQNSSWARIGLATAGQRDDGMVVFAIIAFSRPTAKAAGTARGGLWPCGLREARCGPGRRPGHPDLIAGPG